MRKTSAAVLLASAMLLTPAVASHADVQTETGTVLQAGQSTADDEMGEEAEQTADDVSDAANWGWLGLLGLVGLAGLMGRNRRDPVHTTTATRRDRDHDGRADVNRGNGNALDRDGDGRVRDDAARAMDRDRDGRIG